MLSRLCQLITGDRFIHGLDFHQNPPFPVQQLVEEQQMEVCPIDASLFLPSTVPLHDLHNLHLPPQHRLQEEQGEERA